MKMQFGLLRLGIFFITAFFFSSFLVVRFGGAPFRRHQQWCAKRKREAERKAVLEETANVERLEREAVSKVEKEKRDAAKKKRTAAALAKAQVSKRKRKKQCIDGAVAAAQTSAKAAAAFATAARKSASTARSKMRNMAKKRLAAAGAACTVARAASGHAIAAREAARQFVLDAVEAKELFEIRESESLKAEAAQKKRAALERKAAQERLRVDQQLRSAAATRERKVAQEKRAVRERKAAQAARAEAEVDARAAAEAEARAAARAAAAEAESRRAAEAAAAIEAAEAAAAIEAGAEVAVLQAAAAAATKVEPSASYEEMLGWLMARDDDTEPPIAAAACERSPVRAEEAGATARVDNKQPGLMECSICYEPFTRPITLACGHTFCEEHLDAMPHNRCAMRCALPLGSIPPRGERSVNIDMQNAVAPPLSSRTQQRPLEDLNEDEVQRLLVEWGLGECFGQELASEGGTDGAALGDITELADVVDSSATSSRRRKAKRLLRLIGEAREEGVVVAVE